MEASVYLHIPFCSGACDYCDFYSVKARPDDPRFDPFVNTLLQDVRKSIQLYEIQRVPTLYLGGGTPSLLGAATTERLMKGLIGILPSMPGEITIEANPESATAEFIAACASSGATRLSLGVQSRDEKARKAVGRIGDAGSIDRVVSDIGRLFPGSLSLDLISGLPFQTAGSLLDDIEFAASSGADHVSLYALTLEPGTPLHSRSEGDPTAVPGSDEADELWLLGRDALEQKGFAQYEVSNFSLPGKESRHNARYWRMQSYIGCGPGAVGTVVDESKGIAVRHSWPADVDRLLGGIRFGHQPVLEEISRKELISECLIMGFRTRSGIDDQLFRARFGVSVDYFVGETVDRWRRKGDAESDRPALTRDGLLRLNPFLVSCLEELDAAYPKYEESRR